MNSGSPIPALDSPSAASSSASTARERASTPRSSRVELARAVEPDQRGRDWAVRRPWASPSPRVREGVTEGVERVGARDRELEAHAGVVVVDADGDPRVPASPEEATLRPLA